MILTTSMLMDKLNKYSDPAGKISRMKQAGELFLLKRGVYENDGNVSGHCLAGVIFGPSYLSYDYALSVYGLIPEAVYTFTSATINKKKVKEYRNHFGCFSYHDIPFEAYPFGISVREENGYLYQIAVPEKALCDKLYIMPPVTSQKGIEKMLFDDLRIDSEEFEKLNFGDILQIGEKYHCNNLKYLMKYLRRNEK